MKNEPREKMIVWSSPEETLRDSEAVTGLDHLRAIKEGRIPPPPIARLVGYQIVDIAYGKAVFELTPEECHYNPFSTVHGGILSTLLDTSLTASVISTLPVGKTCATIDLFVKYIRPATVQNGTLRCVAEIIHTGKKLATAEGRITDVKDRLIAHGVATCSIIS